MSFPVQVTSSNNTFTLSVNGETSQTISIPPGNYTPAQLAEEIQSLIGTDSVLSSNKVTVQLNGSALEFSTGNFGSTASIAFVGGTALGASGPIGFTAGQTGTGTDVAGSFTVNGVTEAATGRGQTLTGNTGNANTAGLALQVSLTPAQVAANPTSTVTVTRGIASSFDQTLSSLLNPSTGELATVNTGYAQQITDFQTQITESNTALQQQQQALLTQFANLEAQVSALKSVGAAISASFGTSSTSSTSSSSGSSSSGSSSSSSGSGG